jgi:hypothetical protein
MTPTAVCFNSTQCSGKGFCYDQRCECAPLFGGFVRFCCSKLFCFRLHSLKIEIQAIIVKLIKSTQLLVYTLYFGFIVTVVQLFSLVLLLFPWCSSDWWFVFVVGKMWQRFEQITKSLEFPCSSNITFQHCYLKGDNYYLCSLGCSCTHSFLHSSLWSIQCSRNWRTRYLLNLHKRSCFIASHNYLFSIQFWYRLSLDFQSPVSLECISWFLFFGKLIKEHQEKV